MNSNKLNKVLIGIIIFLVSIILIGTVFGLIKKITDTPDKLMAEGRAESLEPPEETADTAYFELGTMRLIPEQESNSQQDNTKDSDDVAMGTVMIITPWLAYPTGDTVFYEEIARKQSVIKSIFRSYFSQRTKNQILSETEENITKNLIQQINNKFSLGKISNIYFTDYLVLE